MRLSVLPLAAFGVLFQPILGTAVPRRNGNSNPSSCEAKVEMRKEGKFLVILGHCHNASPVPVWVRYELRTDRRGSAGSSHNAQAGRMLVPAEQDIILSKTTIMAGPQDAYQVWLRLLDDQGAPISDDSLRYSPASAGR